MNRGIPSELFRMSERHRRNVYVAPDGTRWLVESDGYVLAATTDVPDDVQCTAKAMPDMMCARIMGTPATHEIEADELRAWCSMCPHMDPPATDYAPMRALGVPVNARLVAKALNAMVATEPCGLVVELAAFDVPSLSETRGVPLLVMGSPRWHIAIVGLAMTDDAWPDLQPRRYDPVLTRATRLAAKAREAEHAFEVADQSFNEALQGLHAARSELMLALRPLSCEDRARLTSTLAYFPEL